MFVVGVIVITVAIVYGSYVQVHEHDRETRKEIVDCNKEE
jgi:hypothetical protein